MHETVKPIYDKQITCPLCSVFYTTKRIRTRFVRVQEIESDFFTHYKDPSLNPIFYEVCVCSQCGYAFTDAFTNHFSDETMKKIKQTIVASWKPKDYSGVRSIDDAIKTQMLALVSGTTKDEKSIIVAGICLRIAWLYRMKENTEQENRFLELALNKYNEAYINSEHLNTSMSEMRLLYLIGELNRRLGNRDAAIKNFSLVIQHKNRSLEQKIVEMAREQWYITRDNETQK